MTNNYKTVLTALVLIIIASLAFAISTDQAVAITTTQNNYLMTNETASVLNGQITYKTDKYTVVAATSNSTINAYIPINDTTGVIASQDVEVREIIKTAIIYSKINTQNQNMSASNWPFSYSTKSYFSDLANDFGALKNGLITVQTELNKLTDNQSKELSTSAAEAKTMTDELTLQCTQIETQLEIARQFETNFFNTPDTNNSTKYENYYKEYFNEINTLRNNFNTFDKKLTELSQGIGAAENPLLTIDQKRSFQSILTTPVNTRRLPTFFSQTDQLRTTIEGIFNDAKNSEGFAATLASRKSRSEAWVLIYGRNETLLKVDPSFETLQTAADAVLLSTNVDLWNNQDAVTALKSNYTNAKSRFESSEYEKSKIAATTAINNIKLIITDGIQQTTNNSNELITQVIIGLAAAGIILFIIEKFILNKKKKKEEYDEPEYN